MDMTWEQRERWARTDSTLIIHPAPSSVRSNCATAAGADDSRSGAADVDEEVDEVADC